VFAVDVGISYALGQIRRIL